MQMNVNLYKWKGHFTENILDWSMNAVYRIKMEWFVGSPGAGSVFVQNETSVFYNVTGLGSKIHLPLSLANLC